MVDDQWTFVELDLDELCANAGVTINGTFVVMFQQRGSYRLMGGTRDGLAFDDVYVRTTSYAGVPYEFGFETGVQDDYWHYKNTVYGRTFVRSSWNNQAKPYAGSYYLAMDNYTGSSWAQNEARLHLDLSDVASEPSVLLSFWWQDFDDNYDNPNDGVFISANGGKNWTRAETLRGDDYTNDTWYRRSIDLKIFANKNGLTMGPNWVIKFAQYGAYTMESTNTSRDGMALDNVSVTLPEYGTLPYFTSFEAGVEPNWSAQSFPSGRVWFGSQNGQLTGTNQMMLDAWQSDWSTNAVYMYLNLDGESTVYLEFWMKDFNDDFNSGQDAVFMSDDGGANFVKIGDLNNTDGNWKMYRFDLAALAASNSKTLSSTFVVKLQQYDYSSISNDGFAFENLRVVRDPEYAMLPFNDGFEDNKLTQNWTVDATANSYPVVTKHGGPHGDAGNHLMLANRTTDGSAASSRAILNLNLQDLTQAELSFWWKELADTDTGGATGDGVFFSSDGGNTWVRVFDLFGNTGTWQQTTLDVDALVAANPGVLEMSPEFKVKFQYNGAYTGSGASGWLQYHGRYYKVFQENQTWTYANTECKKYGGELVSFTDNSERSWVYNNFGYGEWWIGLNDITSEGTWKWTDGTPYSYTYWYSSRPDGGTGENCVVFFRNNWVGGGYWDDRPCTDARYYMCETPSVTNWTDNGLAFDDIKLTTEPVYATCPTPTTSSPAPSTTRGPPSPPTRAAWKSARPCPRPTTRRPGSRFTRPPATAALAGPWATSTGRAGRCRAPTSAVGSTTTGTGRTSTATSTSAPTRTPRCA
jgi:hypothetical protein